MRHCGLQYVAAATLGFAQTQRKACDFPTCACTMANHSCFVMSKYGAKPFWKKLLPSMRIYMAESERGEEPQQWNWHDKAAQVLLLGLPEVVGWFTDPACQVCEGTIQRKRGWISGLCAIWDAFPAPWAWAHFSSCYWWIPCTLLVSWSLGLWCRNRLLENSQ